jgi:hypothetical protein
VLARRNRRESRFPAMKPILFASSLPIPVLRPRYNPTENDLFVRRLACTGQVDDRKAYTSGRYNPTENDLYVPPSIGSLLAGRRDSRPPVVRLVVYKPIASLPMHPMPRSAPAGTIQQNDLYVAWHAGRQKSVPAQGDTRDSRPHKLSVSS